MADVADEPDLAGRTLIDRDGRRYEIIRLIGEGSFGSVYLAAMGTAAGFDRRVALKMLRPEACRGTQAVARLKDEARLLARMRHPVIVAAGDLAVFDDRIGLVTEYVEGLDLDACMAAEADPLPMAALLDAIGQVAGALAAAHDHLGVIHRDVKPANIRIGRHGNPVLLDFGIARSDALQRRARTKANVVVGSLAYLAPERITHGPLHPGSDVFALGCVLFEGARGRRLYQAQPMASMLSLAVDRRTYRGFVEAELAPIEPDLRELIARALTFRAEDRIAAADLTIACERLAIARSGALSPLRAWCRARSWAPESRPIASGPPHDIATVPPSALATVPPLATPPPIEAPPCPSSPGPLPSAPSPPAPFPRTPSPPTPPAPDHSAPTVHLEDLAPPAPPPRAPVTAAMIGGSLAFGAAVGLAFTLLVAAIATAAVGIGLATEGADAAGRPAVETGGALADLVSD